jgi:type IV secretion system protein VirB9
MVTLVVLDPDETITEVAAGLGGDCSKTDAAWCIAAQPGGRNLFVKAKSTATAANNLAVVTDRRTHSFRFVVLPDNDPKPPVYRLVVKAPVMRSALPTPIALPEPPRPALAFGPPAAPPPQQVLAERLQAKPQVLNSNYSIAEGKDSEDIVPTLAFDDGRFTLRLRATARPWVFHVLGTAARRWSTPGRRPAGRGPGHWRLMLRAARPLASGTPRHRRRAPNDGTTVPGFGPQS